jgi:hypothetical protein
MESSENLNAETLQYVEYLAVIEKANTFCDSAPAFTKLLQVDSTISVAAAKISYKNIFSCQYLITSGEIEGKEQRFFHLKFGLPRTGVVDLENFALLLKSVRAMLAKIGAKVAVLWDDISFEYSRQAYEMVYSTENLMRKLITNFMLIKVGVHWVNEATPPEVKEVIGKTKREDYLNPLHNVDFIHLADFLVKPYSNTTNVDLIKQLRSVQTVDDIQKLKDQLPLSNWNRYFSNLVDCEDTYLNARWSELYELRCKIAHNAFVTKIDFETIRTLSADLNDKIRDAIEKLPQVTVPTDEVKNIAENAVQNINVVYGDFIFAWKELEEMIFEKAKSEGFSGRGVRSALMHLSKIGFVTEGDITEIELVSEIRNFVIHPSDRTPSEAEIVSVTEIIKNRIKSIYEYWYPPL